MEYIFVVVVVGCILYSLLNPLPKTSNARIAYHESMAHNYLILAAMGAGVLLSSIIGFWPLVILNLIGALIYGIVWLFKHADNVERSALICFGALIVSGVYFLATHAHG